MNGRRFSHRMVMLAIFGLMSAPLGLAQTPSSQSILGAAAPARSTATTGAIVSASQIAVAPAVTGTNGIQYNGGPILDDANGVNVYFIWYGDWSQNRDAKRILENFITHLGGTPYFNVDTSYYSLSPGANGEERIKDRVVNAVHYRGSAEDNYSQGSSLTAYQVYLAVANSILRGAVPADRNAVYFLLTSSDVYETGFGTRHCGWHSSSVSSEMPLVDGIDLHYAFVGNADPQYSFECIWDYQTPLSGNLGADGMANIIAHELSETVTDPDGNAWVNPDKQENADLCAWTFGLAVHSGSAQDPYPPNLRLHGVPYLIQELWLNADGGSCVLWRDE